MKNNKIIIALLCTPLIVLANGTNSSLQLAIPQAPGSYLSDRFRSGEMDCSMGIGSGTNVEFGVTGIINQNNDPLSSNFGTRSNDVGVYGRIIIPIGGPKERIDCNVLYKLEMEKKRLEVLKLKEEINKLKGLKFEN